MLNTDVPAVPRRDARFDACFRQHYARVLAYALRRTRDRTAAEDIAAETFLVAWRRLDDVPDDPLAWLLGIARHVVHNQARASRRRERLVARVGAQPERPREGAADTLPDVERVRRALDRLSERDRKFCSSQLGTVSTSSERLPCSAANAARSPCACTGRGHGWRAN